MSKRGTVRHDHRGWHIDFRGVLWPGAAKPRRIRISRAPQSGKFADARSAESCLNVIRDRAMSRPLHEVLGEYLSLEVPENTVLHRWEHDFVESKRHARARGELSASRLRELEATPGRGYLDYWSHLSVAQISSARVFRWREWLGQAHPQLSAVSLRHVLADFRTFTRYLQLVGAIDTVPQFPQIKILERPRRVPEPVSLGRILAEIPEEIRGLWLARSLAGLRPSEARRLNRVHYADGVLTLPAEITKTKKARALMIGAVVPELDAWIRAWRLDARPWEALFINPSAWRTERRWQATPERRVWVAALEAAGVEHVPPNQGGRHAFATNEIAQGTDPYALRDWMGHSNLQTTQGYVSVTAVTLARRMRPRETGPAADQSPNTPNKTEQNQ